MRRAKPKGMKIWWIVAPGTVEYDLGKGNWKRFVCRVAKHQYGEWVDSYALSWRQCTRCGRWERMSAFLRQAMDSLHLQAKQTIEEIVREVLRDRYDTAS